MRLGGHIPPGQFGRYLLVGASNTLVGYASFAAVTATLSSMGPYSYVVAYLLVSFLNITWAFLGYKHFVFKTKGNYVREWGRCVAVYGGSICLNLVLLPVTVEAIRHWTRYGPQAPYLAGALLTGLGVIYAFVGHKQFSFR